MEQEILVYVVLSAALGYVLHSVYRFFSPKHRKRGGCAGCSMGQTCPSEMQKKSSE